jgi:ABC-type oligopeptide transport system substrate-binding subunit
MHKRFLLALTCAVIGAGLLVAAAFAGSTAPTKASKSGSAEAKRGGTLRVNLSETDFEFLDPALAYDSAGWTVLFATNMTLLNYPDKPAPVGNRLTPEAAAAFPTVSKDGKTYTFTVRSGIKFSDGSAVTAASFKRAIERAADPNEGSPAIAFLHTVVGADARNEGKAGSVSGVTARGQKLTVKLTKADPTFLAQIAMPFFAAVKPNMPINPKGENVYPSAGPYHIVSRDVGRQLVLERNKNYKGTRPANADRIVITVLTDQAQSFLQTKAGQVDYDMGGVPPTAHQELFNKYGVNKSRYFVNPGVNVFYVALNTSRPAFQNVNVRKAVNYAIDRPAMLRVGGLLAGKRTDQILPPSMRGFRDAKLYPIKGADPAKAKQLSGGASSDVTILHTTSASSVARGQILQFNLKQMGLNPKLKPQPFGVAIKTAGDKHGDFDAFLIGWLADYPDPFDFINVLMDGNNIQESNNSNYAYLNIAKYNKAMNAAARLTGNPRYEAYGKLDVDLMQNAAPWAPMYNGNTREFIGARLTNYIYHPVYAGAVLNALAIK